MHKLTGGGRALEELRQRAEQKLATLPNGVTDPPAVDEQRLLHELQVHQMELEMQNEALQEACSVAERAQERYAELFEFAPMPYFTLGRDGVIQQTNFLGAKLLGAVRSAITGQQFVHSISPEFRPVFIRFLEDVFSSDVTQSQEIMLRIGNMPCWVAIEAITDKSRQFCLAAVLDISERKRAAEELQLAATVYLALGEAIMVADKDHRIVAINPAFSRLTKYSARELIGRSTALLQSRLQDKVYYQDLCETLDACGHWDGEIGIRRKNGNECLLWLSISSVFDDHGDVIRRVGMFSEITEKRRTEAIIRKQANIDPLTELPNRRLFLDRLQRAVNKAHREHQQFALILLDLDHFKDVNDTLGHTVGDVLLKETAKRLINSIRETDTLARLGGDEFTIIVGELDDVSSIDRVVQCVQNKMSVPFQLEAERRYVSFSIGIAVYPNDSINQDDLLKKADQAMYAAKRQGRNGFCYFTSDMQEAAQIRSRLTRDLRKALAGRQFWMAYQPIVDLATGGIQKAEALIRWQHPSLGLLFPSEFIHIAEDTGFIVELGEWVFQQAAEQAKKWRECLHPNFQISVNKSPIQFGSSISGQPLWFESLRYLGLPGVSISVEITESLLLDDSSDVSKQLIAYRDAGMQVSLDDFGTGYSSLAYLKKFGIDYLKIDQTFVCNLGANPTDRVLCEAMILMAHKLGMKVIAEGIETQEQRNFLFGAGCDYGQGYLFSRPVPTEEFEMLFMP